MERDRLNDINNHIQAKPTPQPKKRNPSKVIKRARQEPLDEIPADLPLNPLTRQQKIDVLIETASRREQLRLLRDKQ